MKPILLLFIVGATVPLLLSSVQPPAAHAQEIGGGVDVPGDWWLGEGLKQGDQFSYRLCHVNYKECQFFEIDLWIEGDRQVGSEQKWLAKAVVYDGHHVIKGDMEFGKIAAEPTGGDPGVLTYRSAFKSSVSWLSSFATSYGDKGGEGPKSFNMISWGKIGNIGGQQIKPLSAESVTVPAGTFDSIKVGWRTGGADSAIWVVDGFPFPVRASTWTHVSEGQPPQEYAFTLLDYKEDVRSNPFADIKEKLPNPSSLGCPDLDNVPFASVKKTTVNFKYGLEILYKPEEPRQGCDIEWLIKFKKIYDETEFLNQVQYDIMVVDLVGGEVSIPPIRNLAADDNKQFLYSPSGLAERTMTVKEPVGTNNYMIIVYGLAPEFVALDTGETADYAIMPLNVRPNDEYVAAAAADPDASDTVASPSPSPSPAETKIPSWVKSNAGLWSDGKIGDGTFVVGLQYLIQERIIVIPDTRQGVTSGDGQIPSWVKSNAGLWSDGTIDDGTFVVGIQYMIEQGIISIT